MKIFGTISELVKVVFRSGNRETKLDAATQTGSQTDVTFRLPDLVNNSGTAVVATIVEKDLAQVLTNKTIDADLNTLSNIENADIKAGAGIEYSKLNLQPSGAGAIVNADISTTAAIALSKLATGALPSAITVDSSNIVNDSITNDDINASAAIAYSKLALSSSIVGSDLANNISLPGVEYGTAQNATLTSNTLTPSAGKIIHRITSGATLDMIDTPTSGRMLVLLNATGSDVTVNNATGGTAANQIITGTGDSFTLLSGAAAVVTYNSGDSKWALVSGGGGSGGGTIDNIVQASSFAVGDVLYLLGSTYTKAEATSASTGEVVGIVSKVVTAGQKYQMTLAGEVAGIAASQFTEAALPAAGEAIFLSTTPGKMTITEPSVLGQVSVPLGVSLGGGAMYFLPKRGTVLGGTNARTELPLSNNASTTIYTTPTGLEAGEIKGWVYLDATTDYRFFLSAQFARNGANSDWNLSYQTTGDTPPAGFNVTMSSAANGVISIVLPNLAGFSSGKINYALNAPAVGVTFPLAIDAGLVTTGTLAEARLPQVSSSGQGAFPSLTSSLDNATATQLGLKQYFHGTTYNGGNAPTVTSAQAGFSVVRAVFIPYQTQDGAWRLRFNISSSITSTSSSISMTISTNGVVYKNVTNFFQPVAVSTNGATPAPVTQSIANPNSAGIVILINAGTTIGGVHCSGDVELNGKPTWAY